MSNKKYTIYQRLTKMFGYNGQPIPTNNSYNFSKNDLLKTDSKDEYDKTLLQSQQSQYITDKWAKLDQSLYNQSVYYEANRLAAYYDFESMEFTPEISAALDIFSEESSQISEKGEMLTIFSESDRIKTVLEDLFKNKLDINTNLPMWTRGMCKYGDDFVYLKIDPNDGIIGCQQLPNIEIERIEGGSYLTNKSDNMNQSRELRFAWKNRDMEFQNWEIAHFRLLGDDRKLPYGTSILDKIRRIWKQLLLAEDAMLIYRTTRAPERRVFKVFVGNMDDKDIESYVQRVANKFKRDQVVDQKTGQVDMRYNQMPVWSKTPIPLLDGRTITIEELAKEYEEGKQNWVYSIQDKTFAVVPGKVIWCGKNYTANKLIKVWLDDETWVLTAPEHPFILRDGKKVNAEDLKEGDSLMPYYVKKSNQKDGLKIKDYDMIYNPKNGKYQFVHRLVSNSALLKEREQCRKETSFKINNNLTVHHIDFNKNNNSVENLLWIGNVDHIKLHSEYGRINITKYNKSEKKRERNKYLAKRDSWHLRMSSYNHSELHKEHNSIRREAQIKDWSNPEKKLERSVGMRVVLDDNVFEKINEKIISREIINRKTMMEFLSTDIIDYIISINNNKRLNKIKLVNRCVLERHILNKGFKTITDYIDEIKKNHKVSRIETIYENEDVYCMTVVGINGEEDRHNFALKSFKNDKIVSESGVFVSNSVDQDFFIPVRDIAQQNPIETLPGAANLGEIQDIEYLQKKMLAALRVPKAFLGFEDVVGEGKSLALMDIRFARTINKVQKSLIHELNKIALLHLLILGFEDELNNFTLSLTNPSSQSDLLKIEQWKEKITLYKDATSDQSQLGILPVSHTWAKKNILGMSESEVLLDLQQQRLERALGFELSNTQQVIKRTRVFDQVDAKYGISEEDRKKLDATADTEGGDSMGLGSTAPSAPTDGGEALSEDINLFSVIKDKEDLIFDNNKSTDIINELNDKIKDIIK
jgi:hypothetical protein